MHRFRFLVVYLLIGCAIENVKGSTSSAVPDWLFDCYNNNFTDVSSPPLTIQLLIELIRRIELDEKNAYIAGSTRILATSMLHGVKFDGIRQYQVEMESDIVPFRASGVEFYNYQLLVDFLTSGKSSQFPRDSLTTPEFCFLHQLISNTVEPMERGDESSTCVPQESTPVNIEIVEDGDRLSACPMQKGNVRTKWGPVSPGHIVGAVASVLQQSESTFSRIEDAINKHNTNVTPTITTNSNTVNNVWVSTIVGDLARVILNQATKTPEIGNSGFWNDTKLPRVFYLKTPKWDMTETQVLGGIDALTIANYLKNSQSSIGQLRFSQLIDMYYSPRGIGNNRQYSVTNRSGNLNQLLNEINLEEQVLGTAKLLQGLCTYEMSLNEQGIQELTSIVLTTFKEIAASLAKNYDKTEYINERHMKAPVEIITILDGSFDAYTAQQLLYALSETTQVSYYGSKLGVINGQSGNWMANVTGELFQLYADIERTTNWPATLSLGTSLETVIYHYQNKSDFDCLQEVQKPIGRAILIVSPDGRLTDSDTKRAQAAFQSIKRSNPEVSVIFATSAQNQQYITEFTNIFLENDYVITPPKDVLSFVGTVAEKLSEIPANIINFYCKQPLVLLEDYITPEVESIYQIRKQYLQRRHITVKFPTVAYGNLQICARGSGQETCKNTAEGTEIQFDTNDLCPTECNLELRVLVNSTENKCIEVDCRYPDQVRLGFSWQPSSGTIPSTYLFQLVSVIMLIIKIFIE